MIRTFDLIEFVPYYLPKAKACGQWVMGRSGSYMRGFVAPEHAKPIIEYLRQRFGHRGREKVVFLQMWPGGVIRPHVDDFKQADFQYLLMLQPAVSGGVLTLHFEGEDRPSPTKAGQCIGFDANTIRHSVTKVEEGSRYVLSVWFYKG